MPTYYNAALLLYPEPSAFVPTEQM